MVQEDAILVNGRSDHIQWDPSAHIPRQSVNEVNVMRASQLQFI